jgi:hypothetical protein
MSPVLTPLHIRILLHYYYAASQWGEESKSDSLQEFQCELCRMELLRHTKKDDVYSITDRGRAHVEALKSLPLPELKTVEKWVTPYPAEENI